MRSIALSSAAVGVIVTSLFTATPSGAQTTPDEDTIDLANQTGVSPTDLEGALNTLHAAGYDVDARSYLGIAVGELAQPPAPIAHGHMARVRLTYYVEAGVTYSGSHPFAGSTACSWNFAIGTRFRLPDGEVVTCNDRGMLGGDPGWLDLWRRPDLAHAYGPYAHVEVLP